jgi:hypothetical protein
VIGFKPVLRVLWLAASAALVLLYVAVVVPERHTVSQMALQAQTLYEAADSDERIIAQEAKIDRARTTVASEIQSVAAHPQGPSAMLDALDADSRRFGVRIVALHPNIAPAPTAAKVADPLSHTELTLGLEGGYAPILRFISDVSQTYPLLEIVGVTLENAPDQASGVTLRATLDASVYELSENWKELIDGAASPGR